MTGDDCRRRRRARRLTRAHRHQLEHDASNWYQRAFTTTAFHSERLARGGSARAQAGSLRMKCTAATVHITATNATTTSAAVGRRESGAADQRATGAGRRPPADAPRRAEDSTTGSRPSPTKRHSSTAAIAIAVLRVRMPSAVASTDHRRRGRPPRRGGRHRPRPEGHRSIRPAVAVTKPASTASDGSRRDASPRRTPRRSATSRPATCRGWV